MNKIIEIIKSKLTPSLLPKWMHDRNVGNPMYGHCYHSSATLKHYYPNLKLNKGLDWEGQWHWWCVDEEGNIIDITSEQYTSIGKPLPYNESIEAKELWQGSYKDRVKRLINAVECDKNNKWFNYEK
jgi:hypothetical protein